MFKAYRADLRIKKARLYRATELDLGNMGLTEVPEAIGQLTSLQELNLRENQISSLPEGLGKLTSLQRLDLSFNQSGCLQVGPLYYLGSWAIAHWWGRRPLSGKHGRTGDRYPVLRITFVILWN